MLEYSFLESYRCAVCQSELSVDHTSIDNGREVIIFLLPCPKCTTKKGTADNPYDNMQDALDACDGTGKTIFVYNKNSKLTFWTESEPPEEGKND